MLVAAVGDTPASRRYNRLVETPAVPGADFVDEGLSDLRAGRETVASLLVSIGAPRLRQLGLDLPAPFVGPEHRLYERLSLSGAATAHSRYNALLRRLVSFERAFACAR